MRRENERVFSTPTPGGRVSAGIIGLTSEWTASAGMIGVRGRGNFTTENKKGTEKEKPETRGLRFSRMAMGKRIRLLTGDVAPTALTVLCILFPGLTPWASFWRAYRAD